MSSTRNPELDSKLLANAMCLQKIRKFHKLQLRKIQMMVKEQDGEYLSII